MYSCCYNLSHNGSVSVTYDGRKGQKFQNLIFSAYRKIKSEILPQISDFIFSTYRKIKSEICGKISDFIFLYAEKIKSEMFVPFGHRSYMNTDTPY